MENFVNGADFLFEARSAISEDKYGAVNKIDVCLKRK